MVIDLCDTSKAGPIVRLHGRLQQLLLQYLENDVIPADRLVDAVDVSFVIGGEGKMNQLMDEFMPNYWKYSLSERLEVIRLLSFTTFIAEIMAKILSKSEEILPSDVRQSVQEKTSLLHSAAIAVGIRYANYVLDMDIKYMFCHTYDWSWDNFLLKVLEMSEETDLVCIEQTIPSDFYAVPAWTGTPLVSFLGGVLAFVAPEMPVYEWDCVLQECLMKWLYLLSEAGIDLFKYGELEKRRFSAAAVDIRGAFDSNAVEVSKTIPRRHLTPDAGGFTCRRARRRPSKQYRERKASSPFLHKLRGFYDQTRQARRCDDFVPVRLVGLQTGHQPEDWKLFWAPEFEHLAQEFWHQMEYPSLPMPGDWTEM